jgi:2-oxoglutarate dehydrogenase E2 component (dihydrolipoamide succinyltransferase)
VPEVEVVLPRWGETMEEAVVVEWLRAEGERVELDEPICLIETDKVDAEIPSPAAGTVTRHLVAARTRVAVGARLALIAADAPT